jgi:hypothetical protein
MPEYKQLTKSKLDGGKTQDSLSSFIGTPKQASDSIETPFFIFSFSLFVFLSLYISFFYLLSFYFSLFGGCNLYILLSL